MLGGVRVKAGHGSLRIHPLASSDRPARRCRSYRATGSPSCCTNCGSVKGQRPAELIVAVPVAPSSTSRQWQQQCDDVDCLLASAYFLTVGQSSESFLPVEEQRVVDLLQRHRTAASGTAPVSRDRSAAIGQPRSARPLRASEMRHLRNHSRGLHSPIATETKPPAQAVPSPTSRTAIPIAAVA